jgi:hypothetical protein
MSPGDQPQESAMRLGILRSFLLGIALLDVSPLYAQAQQAAAAPRVVRLTGTFAPANGQPSGPVEAVTLAIYAQETGGTPLWQETQYVAVDTEGRYSVLLGATLPEGVPLDLFASGDARWLGRRFDRPGEQEQARVLLTSVPYALKASDADTLGGRPPSAFLLADHGANGASHGNDRAERDSSTGTATPSITVGTTNYIGKFTSPTDLSNSSLYDTGATIGLGTTTPNDYFHVRFYNDIGTATGLAVQNTSGSANAYSGMLFYDQNGALGQFQGFNNTTHEYRINNIATSGSINFMLGSASKFRVNSNGRIGINTSSTPTSQLEVSGDVRSFGDFFSINGDFKPLGTAYYGVRWSDANGAIQAHIHRWGASNNALYVTNAGAGNLTGVYLATSATSWTSSSDERLTTDIEPITNILQKIRKIRVVGFNMASLSVDKASGKAVVNREIAQRRMKNGTAIKQQIGSIAQDWLADFPELVVEPNGEDDYYGLDYDRIGVVALGAAKELSDLLAQKDAEIKALTDRLNALEQQIQRLAR